MIYIFNKNKINKLTLSTELINTIKRYVKFIRRSIILVKISVNDIQIYIYIYLFKLK